VDDLVIVANEPALFADLHLPIRADLHPGLGALAGVETALRRAMDLGRPGTLCVACDLPFVPADLLRVIVYRASKTDGDAVVPESTGRRGIEPLCAWYSVDALPAAERALASGDRSMASFVASVRAERISLDHVRRFGDPDILFLNVNTREDLARAESHASTEDGRS
jgi:molybdopterin-guanine dinucleotide biosynthesis protein A